MPIKDEFNNLSQRLAELGARLEESARSGAAGTRASHGIGFLESSFNNIRDLFTKGVTGEELKDLVHYETRETFRFYTREIDFAALKFLPWYKRYPSAAWKIFVATAYRLNPPRRIAFALAIFAFLLGCAHFLTAGIQRQNIGTGILAWLASLSLFALLLLMELRDKLGLKVDLEIAREIQVGLVPSQPYHRPGIAIYSHMRPANTVGGDYHDILELAEGSVGVVIGDVAGKGMPAALMMALLQGSLRTLLTAGHRGSDLVLKLNEYLFDNIPDNRLVTLFYGELNKFTGELRYVNAGHNAPFLLRPGRVPERLTSTSMVLGVMRDCAFSVCEARLDPEDSLLLFTDGVSETFNSDEEEYGEERLASFLRSHASLAEDALIPAIIKDVLGFCSPQRPADDMTMMLIVRRPPLPEPAGTREAV